MVGILTTAAAWRVQVDVIISEWMGYFLMYESMLDNGAVRTQQVAGAPGGLLHARPLHAQHGGH